MSNMSKLARMKYIASLNRYNMCMNIDDLQHITIFTITTERDTYAKTIKTMK